MCSCGLLINSTVVQNAVFFVVFLRLLNPTRFGW